ncbi:MAG: GHKL domain-containing protein, partial [Candidatus Omnitrophica bacterium]|nr:GHKL domain-containing protein [Candidatus Omnitrophota bacterium]
TNKMKKLIDEFKSLRGEIALNKKEHNLKGLVEESVIDLGKERINGIKLDINVEESLEIQVDSHHFGKVILNLLINAIEAMEGKGNISVEANSKNGSVSLLIKDTGKGMTEDFIENRLFKPFSSTKKQGMGIGLYQCKSIIEAHNGTIVANSSVNVGTTFTITLPK